MTFYGNHIFFQFINTHFFLWISLTTLTLSDSLLIIRKKTGFREPEGVEVNEVVTNTVQCPGPGERRDT